MKVQHTESTNFVFRKRRLYFLHPVFWRMQKSTSAHSQLSPYLPFLIPPLRIIIRTIFLYEPRFPPPSVSPRFLFLAFFSSDRQQHNTGNGGNNAQAVSPGLNSAACISSGWGSPLPKGWPCGLDKEGKGKGKALQTSLDMAKADLTSGIRVASVLVVRERNFAVTIGKYCFDAESGLQ